MNEKDKATALEIVTTITKTAISLAACRHGLIREGEDDETVLPDEAEEEIIQDVLECLTGEETGCLDPDELSPENCALLMVEDRLTAIREEARRAAFKEARRKVYMISGSTNVDPAIRKGFAAGVNAAIETIAALEAAEKGERE